MAVNYQSIGAYQEAMKWQREIEHDAAEMPDACMDELAAAAARRTFALANAFTAEDCNAYYEIGSDQARRRAAQEAYAAFWDAI